MQGDRRPQDQQRDDSLSRRREDSPGSRGDVNESGGRGANMQSGQTGASGASAHDAMQRQGSSQGAAGQPRYGLARRDQDYGFPSIFGAGAAGGPFALLRRMEQEMDRMFEQFGMGDISGQRGSSRGRGGDMPSLWAPQIEMYERDGKLHICTDLPGMRKEDIHVNIEDDMVTIQGERRSSNEGQEQQQGFYRSERSYGSFYRTIPLPEGVNAENADASFRDGVLDITFDAPSQQRRGRALEIKDASSSQGSTQSGQSSSSQGGTSGSKSQR
ncbi:MAG: Hsp20/alpha crystallin family protein [Burkholderiaceae bacterium]